MEHKIISILNNLNADDISLTTMEQRIEFTFCSLPFNPDFGAGCEADWKCERDLTCEEKPTCEKVSDCEKDGPKCEEKPVV